MNKITALIILSSILSCNSPSQESESQDIDKFFESYLWNTAKHSPQRLTYMGLYEEDSLYPYNSLLNDASDEFRLKMYALSEKYLDTLQMFERSSLTEKRQVSYDILKWNLENKIEGKKYMYHGYLVDQMNGVHINFPAFMSEKHQISNKTDAENYISRLSKIGLKFKQILDRIKIGEEKKMILPKYLIAQVLKQMRDFISGDIKENILYKSFEKKIAEVELTEEEKEKLLKKAEQEITNTVFPAYQLLINYHVHLDSIATENVGVWRFPDGANYYKYVLKTQTSTNLSPEEIHNIGLREAKRLLNEMEVILDSMGFVGSTFLEKMNKFRATMRDRSNEQYYYPDTSDVGRIQILQDYKSILSDAQRSTATIFDIVPQTELKLKRMPKDQELSVGGYYDAASYDGSRPAIVYVNLLRPTLKFTMKGFIYHEAIPGHHYQIAIHRELDNIPRFRSETYYAGFHEGWACYAQRLALEHHLYTDLPSTLAQLSSEFGRAARIILDTGIHYKKWSKQEAMEYISDLYGRYPEYEIDRYIVYPGQACGYMVGLLKILEWREKAKAELHHKFEIKEFHNTILKNGAMPLDILEKIIDRYIEEKKNS